MTPEALDVLRAGVLPALTRREVETVLAACESDDPRLIQGAGPRPFPFQQTAGLVCEGACLLAFGAFAGGTPIVAAADLFLCRAIAAVTRSGRHVGELLAWYDRTPRADALPAVAAELRAELARRDESGKNPNGVLVP